MLQRSLNTYRKSTCILIVGHLQAVAETWGYKFSDTSALNYQCVLELCKKGTDECDGLTPPACGRIKRSIETNK